MISAFQNVTNPSQTPINGDTVSYNLDGTVITQTWSLAVLLSVIGNGDVGSGITAQDKVDIATAVLDQVL